MRLQGYQFSSLNFLVVSKSLTFFYVRGNRLPTNRKPFPPSNADYPDYSAQQQYTNYQAQVKNEDDEEKYRPHEDEDQNGAPRTRGGGENGGRYGAVNREEPPYDDRYGDY